MKNLFLFLFAIVAGGFLLPIMFIYTLIHSILFKKTSKFLLNVAYTIDVMGNVCGEFFEDLVTHEETTLFGKPDVTISASLGHIAVEKKLTKFGIILIRFVDWLFLKVTNGDDNLHCFNAYQLLKSKRPDLF